MTTFNLDPPAERLPEVNRVPFFDILKSSCCDAERKEGGRLVADSASSSTSASKPPSFPETDADLGMSSSSFSVTSSLPLYPSVLSFERPTLRRGLEDSCA